MVVYPPEQERRLRMRMGDFEIATHEAGHPWHRLDLTDSFGRWLGAHEYREALQLFAVTRSMTHAVQKLLSTMMLM